MPRKKAEPGTISIRLPGRRYVGDPPLMFGPPTQEEWITSTLTAIEERDAPLEARENFRTLMDLYPKVIADYGDLAGLARNGLRLRVKGRSATHEAVQRQIDTLRTALAGPDPSPIEQLLADAVAFSWLDYYLFALIYGTNTAASASLADYEKWERVLASKEARYLRAIEELARVRRLLRLPNMQLNVALPHSQQVNIAGELPAARPAPELPG